MSILGYLPLIIFTYAFFRLGRISAGKLTYVILALMLIVPLALSLCLDTWWIAYSAWLAILLLFQLFYGQEPFPIQAPRLTILAVIYIVSLLILPHRFIPPFSSGITLLLIWYWTGFLSLSRCFYTILIFGLYALVQPLELNSLISILSYFFLDQSLFTAQQRFDVNTKAFQQQLMEAQYQEVKEVYLQIRGWRHDYHNHMQSMKAYLAKEQYREMHNYLDELEEDLKSVDTLIKSGHHMVDAILNAKFSLAKKKAISLDVTVKPLAKLPFSDVDLCVILGNLMDNALEACEKIPEEQRFIRLYLDTKGEQLYLSIQNSAKEILNFEERNYISQKRGNHGLGMKRVALLVDKYQGYLNLKNEPGIFACEATLPLMNQRT